MRSSTARLASHLGVALVAAAIGLAVGRAGSGDAARDAGVSDGSTDGEATDGVAPSPVTAAPVRSADVAGQSTTDPGAASVGAVGAAPTSSPSDLIARARSGDLVALKAIEARAPATRTIAEALALEAGHAALAVAEARRLVDDVAAEPALLDDPSTAAHALRLALDPAVAPALLAGLVPIEHASVPDLLFDLASRGEPGARLVLLAEDLLAGPARARASPALDVVLRARAARSCTALMALLPAITDRADDRVLAVLARTDTRTGCGPKRNDDCHACLRDDPARSDLEAARAAARGRPFEPPWGPAARRPQRGSAQQRKPVE